MSGNQTLGIPNSQARIDEVRFALAQVLPNVTRMRKVGLISFGPGTWNYSWTGEQSILQAKCLAEQSGGLYITVDTEQDLVGALEKTLVYRSGSLGWLLRTWISALYYEATREP